MGIPSDVARILDANFNRAREALRVVEDYTRFVRNDPASCETAKRLRHDLATCVGGLPASELVVARDTPNDVGTRISTETERRRADIQQVVVAALKRLPEALRTLEEYSKIVDATASVSLESLRYRAYDLEQRIMCRGSRAARFAEIRLYVLVTASLCRGDVQETASAAMDGGAGCVQLREKHLEDRELLERARSMSQLCRQRGSLFIVNDRPDIAVLSDADGVHLGQTDMSLTDARRMVGPERLIGLSTHTPEQLEAAIDQQPDYIAVGPMFQSGTKPQEHVPGADLLTCALAKTEIPVVAIGGITPDNAVILRQAGARCLCACSVVIGGDDPRRVAMQLADL